MYPHTRALSISPLMLASLEVVVVVKRSVACAGSLGAEINSLHVPFEKGLGIHLIFSAFGDFIASSEETGYY